MKFDYYRHGNIYVSGVYAELHDITEEDLKDKFFDVKKCVKILNNTNDIYLNDFSTLLYFEEYIMISSKSFGYERRNNTKYKMIDILSKYKGLSMTMRLNRLKDRLIE